MRKLCKALYDAHLISPPRRRESDDKPDASFLCFDVFFDNRVPEGEIQIRSKEDRILAILK